jgi:methionyl-tRNA formyltransferase
MRILFVGSVLFSKKALEKLISLKAEIAGVITKQASGFNADFEDLAPIAEKNHIPFKYVNDINHPENLKWINNIKPDIIFCFGWSSLIKKELLSVAKMGVLGFHPSLLPANRGRHPLIWAKILGLPKTGSTFFFMDEGADTGNILNQKEIPITFEEDAGDLYNKMINTALLQIEEFLPQLQTNNFELIIQPKKGNTWRKRDQYDGVIDFRMTSVSICNLVRGLAKPYVGANCNYKNEPIKIWRIEPGNYMENNIEPGKVINIDQQTIEIKTGDGSVIITEHEFTQMPLQGDYIR